MRDWALTLQLWVWLSMGLVGCAVLGLSTDNKLSTERCATHAALGCAAKAALYCTVRGPMDQFLSCIVHRSATCATKGIAGCMYATISPVGAGEMGEAGEADAGIDISEEVEMVEKCCQGARHSGRWSAVEVVAGCYVDVCTGGR